MAPSHASNLKIAASILFLLLSVIVLTGIEASPETVNASGRTRLLSELRMLDYDKLAEEVASLLGVNAYSSPDSFYQVFLSGRTLRLDPASIEAIGVNAARIGFAAFVSGRGWVSLECRIYDSEVYVNGSVVSLLNGRYITRETIIEVKLPTQRPIETKDFSSFPSAFRGAQKLFKLSISHPKLGTLAVIYIVVGLEYDASYCVQYGRTTKPLGYSIHEQPLLAIEAFKKRALTENSRLQDKVSLLTVAAAYNPLNVKRHNLAISIEALDPVPDGGGAPQYSTVYDVRGMHPLEAYTQARNASFQNPAIFNVTLIDDNMYGGIKWRRLIAFVGFVNPTCTYDYVAITIDGQIVYEGIIYHGSIVRVTYDAGASGSFNPWVIVKITPDTCTWTVNILPLVVEYMLPSIYIDDYVNNERIEYKLSFLPTTSRPLRLFLPTTSGASSTSVIAYPFPLLMYGGIGGTSPLQVQLLLKYSFQGSVSPSAFPLTVNYYLGNRLVCTHTISYSEASDGWEEKWCTFSLSSEELLNSLYTQWPDIYVIIVAETSGSPGPLGLTLELSVESLVESSIQVRKLNPYTTASGNQVYTSMIPSSSPLWSRQIRYMEFLATYAIAYQNPTSQGNYLGLAYLTLAFNLYNEVSTVCSSGWVGMSNDWTLVYAATSNSGSYIIEYSGNLYTYETDNVDLRRLDFSINYADGMALSDYNPKYMSGGGTPSDPLPDVPPIVSTIAGYIHPVLGVAVDVYDYIDWTVERIYSQYYVYASATASNGVLTFSYGAGSLTDLAMYPPMPHYYLAFTSGCRTYNMGWSVYAYFEGSWVGAIELTDSGAITRTVTNTS